MSKKTIGERIRQARIAAEMSQAELGKAVGVSQATIANWEADKEGRWLTARNALAEALAILRRIAQATGCPPGDLT